MQEAKDDIVWLFGEMNEVMIPVLIVLIIILVVLAIIFHYISKLWNWYQIAFGFRDDNDLDYKYSEFKEMNE